MQTIACHNCYETRYGNILDVLHYTKTIEIDIWDNFQGSGEFRTGNKMNQDWYVKHTIFDAGNINCCGGSFRDCLNRLKNWSDENINHDILTIFIDKKENWSDQDEFRKPLDLDQMILSIFQKAKIFTPSDLLQDKRSLKAAALQNWPSLDSLKGKFIFVLTDATVQIVIPFISRNRIPLNEYIEAQKNNAICFVAPQISLENEIDLPTGFVSQNAENVVFFNLKYTSVDLSEKINSINCLSRIFDAPETIETYNSLISKKVNFIAMDNLKILTNASRDLD